MLKSYVFDIDSNLLFTDTKILMEQRNGDSRVPVEVSQEDFEARLQDKEQYRYLDNSSEKSLVNFRGPGKFHEDIFKAITGKKFGPSRNKFIEANRYASPIAFITARGHPVEEFKDVHRKIIMDVLTSGQQEDLIGSMKERLDKYRLKDEDIIERYLANNFYAPCHNDDFVALLGNDIDDHISAKKNKAFEHFLIHIKKTFRMYYGGRFLTHRKIRVGFSDDMHYNIQGLHDLIQDKENGLIQRHPDILFRLYDTGNGGKMPIKFSYKNPDEL